MNKIFCQIGDLHLLAIRLFFPSVMSLLYGDLSVMFSRCLSDEHTRLTVMLGPTDRFEHFPILSRVVITDPFPETFPSGDHL